MTDTIGRNKKQVKFQHVRGVIALEHIITEKEKQRSWYTVEEYNRFKFEAARDAGVGLFNSYAHAHEHSGIQGLHAATSYRQTHKFVTVGNFDDKYSNDSFSLITDAATCNTPRKCTNEYNDTIINDREEICKRGLGYHFSRFRKRNKAWTRTTVLIWQKRMGSILLEKDWRRDEMPVNILHQYDAKLNENRHLLLAMLSSKLSCHARQSALWRGKMDHEVAYPEKCESFFHVNLDGSLSIMDPHPKK
jgi:hypothetical protein